MQDNIIDFPKPSSGDKALLVTHGLPVSLTTLIGREREVQAIQALILRPDVRLLTLAGTAGVGKTRLALEVARNLMHNFADSVYFVSLAPVSDPTFVISTIAHTLGLTESGSQPLLDLLKTSQGDKQRLLLLDNFEHVISAAPLLAELLEACPDVKLLVTSREVLRLRGEHQFAVPPLALPDPKRLQDDQLQSLGHVPSMKLFVQRAQAIKADFHVTTDNAAAISEICTRLDGLPLAIELAAARIKLLPPRALLSRLDHRLHVLTGGTRDLPERQQTLRNTLAWSYELLTAQEQHLFRLLSVFVGGCTLEAIEAVCHGEGDDESNVLHTISSLLDKSLVLQREQEAGEPRLSMLETVREYGLECLRESGEMYVCQRAHALYYLTLSEEVEPKLIGAEHVYLMEKLEQEHDNLRATLGWLLEQNEMELLLRLSGALRIFWEMGGYFSEGRRWMESGFEGRNSVSTPVQAKAFYSAGMLAAIQADMRSRECSLQRA